MIRIAHGNKYLADIEFLDDLEKDPPTSCLQIAPALAIRMYAIRMYIACKIYKSKPGVLARAHIIHFGVAKINSKFWAGWPLIVSDTDKQDVLERYYFVEISAQQ